MDAGNSLFFFILCKFSIFHQPKILIFKCFFQLFCSSGGRKATLMRWSLCDACELTLQTNGAVKAKQKMFSHIGNTFAQLKQNSEYRANSFVALNWRP